MFKRYIACAITGFLMGQVLAQSTSQRKEASLKKAFDGYFPIGVSVSPTNLVGEEAELIKSQFNSLTPENAMKFGPLHPEENRYNWAGADSVVAFAQRHQMKARGHTLIWHQQNPKWLFTDAKGDTVSKEVLLARMKSHIQAVDESLQREDICLGCG